MKKTRTLIVLFLIAVLFIQIYMYFNLSVSYKYEVDLAETHIVISNLNEFNKQRELRRIKKRGESIEKIKQYLIATMLVSFVFLAVIANKDS